MRDEVAERMMQRALERIGERGLAVTIDQINLEDVIREAGVSRATAYRRWSSRQAFLSDVLVEAVRRVRLGREGLEEFAKLRSLLADCLAGFCDPRVRRRFFVAALRITVQADFDRLRDSPQTQTYYGITSTCRSIADDRLKDRLRSELKKTSEHFSRIRAEAYRRFTVGMGYRMVLAGVGDGDGFRLMSEAAGAMMHGLVVASYNDPDMAARTFRAASWGSDREEEWTLPAHHIVGLLLSYIEEDPDVVWDRARISGLVRQLGELEASVANAFESEPPR